MESEKEKCQAGELYDANNDAQLIAERTACKDLCHEYNLMMPSNADQRKSLLHQLLGRTGRNFLIE